MKHRGPSGSGPFVTNDHASIDAAIAALDARIAKLEGPPVPPPVLTSGPFGPAINCDTKANLQVGWTNRARLSHRFRASSSSKPSTIRFAQRGGPIYSGGTGGLLRVSLQSDKAGAPDGNILCSATYGPKNPNGGIFDQVSLVGTTSLVKGALYHVVTENVDANPTTNYLSINHLFVYTGVTPRQPKFSDADFAVLYDSGGGWVLQSKYTAVFDLTYADGTHDGQGYVGMIGQIPNAPSDVGYANVSGTASCRERFTPTSDRSVTSAHVRIRRSTGTAPLQVWLDSSSPVLLGSILAADVPLSAAGSDNGGSVWASVSWINGIILKAGTEYSLRLSCPSGTTYTVAPIRGSTDVGFAPSLAFSEGTFEFTLDGSSWKAMYAFAPLSMQEYLT